MSDESKAKAEALARRLAEKGYKLWEEGPCHDPQCACVTVYEVRQFAPVLEKLYEALVRAKENRGERDKVLIACESGLALFDQPDSTEAFRGSFA